MMSECEGHEKTGQIIKESRAVVACCFPTHLCNILRNGDII